LQLFYTVGLDRVACSPSVVIADIATLENRGLFRLSVC